jgi:hypothetical protein
MTDDIISYTSIGIELLQKGKLKSHTRRSLEKNYVVSLNKDDDGGSTINNAKSDDADVAMLWTASLHMTFFSIRCGER